MSTAQRITAKQKAKRIMNMQGKSFAFRLAALCALGTDKGQMTCYA